MKDVIAKIAIYIAIVFLVYASISFLSLEMNPFEWNWIGRLIFLLVVLSGINVFVED